MDKLIINGGRPLYGDIFVSGMKNSALPIIFATILTNDVCVIDNIPPVSDIENALEILSEMGADIKYLNATSVRIDTRNVVPCTAPRGLSSAIRGSSYLLGAELGRFGITKVARPGGCSLANGGRPLDQHMKAFEALGARMMTEGGYIEGSAPNGLKGASFEFNFVTVGGTVNAILAAVLAEGTTEISLAALEPHIGDLVTFLNCCGANITGAGTNTIKVRGVSSLHGCNYTILPDMIEAGTYMAAVAATGGRVNIRGIIPTHMECISKKLIEMGVGIEKHDDYLTVTSNGHLNAVNIDTKPYPGFPTDMQPQFTALLSIADGVSIVTENVFTSRFQYVGALRDMCAKITVSNTSATVTGVGKLKGAPVESTDLRAGAALVIAALVAEGETEITNIGTVERGYYNITGKLAALGADIQKKTDSSNEQSVCYGA